MPRRDDRARTTEQLLVGSDENVTAMKRVLWFHRCAAYYFYTWQLKVKSGIPVWGTVVTTAAWILLNIFNLDLLTMFVFRRRLLPVITSPTLILAIVLVVTLINYFYLMAGGRFDSIIKEFENQSPESASRQRKISSAYFILTFLVLCVLLQATGQK